MKKFDTEIRLSREMSLMDTTLIGVGAMIGAGIFVLTGIAAGVAGPALILAFLLSGFVALFTAMSYAELGSCYHDAGGGYLWVKEGLPKWNGFLAGWMSWFAHAVACSVYALGFGAYFDQVLQEIGVVIPAWSFVSPVKLTAVVISLFIAYVNFRGASETGKLGGIVTLTKIFILAIFIAFGLQVLFTRLDWQAALTPFMPHGFGGVMSAMGLTFIAFEGYEVIAQCSEEVRNPRKNIPRAVFLSLIIVVPIYLLVALTALVSVHPGGLTPWDYLAEHKETALVEVSKNFFIGGGIMLLFGGLISTISALNATVYSSSRVAFAMGRDRNFPGLFSKIHPQRATPHWAILVTLVIIVLMAVTLPIEDVASAASIMFLLLFLQVNIAMIRLRKLRPDLDRGFKAPLFPWLTIFGIVMLLAVAAYMVEFSPVAWIVTAVWIAIGLVIYKVYASEREVVHAQKVRALERLESKQYRILVAISKRELIADLSAVAAAIARKHHGEVLFLYVIEVEQGESLVVNEPERVAALGLVQEAAESLRDTGIPTRTLVQISRRVSQGIVDTVEEEECNFVILGRRKRPSFLARIFTSAIDSIVHESPCEVAVLHGKLPESGVGRLLLPFGSDIHARLALELAPALSESFKCDSEVRVVFEPQVPSAAREQQIRNIKTLVSENGFQTQISAIHDRDIVSGVLQNTNKSDLIVMGGHTGDFVKLLLGRSLGEEITEQAECPVLWVREFEEREPFWISIFKPLRKEEQ
ncbi:MAG: amino acid permease [Calditrichaeota bacterium]|nr:amino acid permease [Calditrichota bacterium]MCB9369912.1 amino acid permease [Calditrichota bacterium]